MMVHENKTLSRPAVYEVARYAAGNDLVTLTPDSQTGHAPVPLAHYLWILRRNRWRLLSFVAVCVVATVIVSLRLPPVYEAIATVDIDRHSAPGVVGREADQLAANDSDQFMATQVKLIQSDSVLRPVAKKYGLREIESPKRPANPAAAEEAPVVLKKLKVTRPPNTYLLQIGYRSTDPKLAADVANAVARSYVERTFDLRFKASASLTEFMEKQIEELKAKMEGSTASLAQFERELNVINPEEKTSILSARLLQLNTEYTNAQAERVRKQAAFQSLSSGSMEAAQSSPQGESLRKLAEHLSEAQEKFAEVQTQYGVNHPEYKRAATRVAEIQRLLEKTRQNIVQRVTAEHGESISREQMLQKAVAATKAEFDAVNARSFEYQQLKREAEADKKLYEEIATRIKEAGINANFQNSAIRIADPARPTIDPVYPNIKLNAFLALFFATVLGVSAAVLTDVLDDSVRDPDEVSKALNTTVVGTLPSVKPWRQRTSPPVRSGQYGMLALDESGDEGMSGFAESIRTLRNSILLADFDHRLKTILITSASPAEGKSTTAAYLALSQAQQGKKTLIVDGDLRKPSLHRRFGVKASVGLSNVLLREVGWREAVLAVPGVEDLDVLPAGPPSRRAADIVGTQVAELLDEASREYDLVIVDAPPLLGFAEPLLMSTGVDGVLVVARAGETSRKCLSTAMSTLTRLRTNVLGVVLNDVNRETHATYYAYYGKNERYYAPVHEPTGTGRT